jgi:uncharacterized protein YndB with AHSA1/START domain
MQNTGTLKIELPSEHEVRMIRVFDAPKQLVFDALSQPELVKKWFGPRGHYLTVCDIDFKVGGAWKYVLHMPDGKDMGMLGVYREIEPPNRIVHTEAFIFDDPNLVGCEAQTDESVVTIQLSEEDGKTTMTVTVEYVSQEIRDAVIESGMEHGAAECYDKMAELLESI